ncbi:MAG: restriction endonuclease subunit S [Chloroflexota bacterium]
MSHTNRYTAYSDYKHSGFEWLGGIPASWIVAPLKYVTLAKSDAIKTGPFGSQLLSSEMQGHEVKVYNQRNVIDRDLVKGDEYISMEKYEALRSFTVFPRDILITTRGTIGRCVIVPENAELGILHPCLMRIQPHSKKILTEYLILLP